MGCCVGISVHACALKSSKHVHSSKVHVPSESAQSGWSVIMLPAPSLHVVPRHWPAVMHGFSRCSMKSASQRSMLQSIVGEAVGCDVVGDAVGSDVGAAVGVHPGPVVTFVYTQPFSNEQASAVHGFSSLHAQCCNWATWQPSG